MKLKIAWALMASLISFGSQAAGVVWEQQPDSFMGIRIGGPASDIPECTDTGSGLCKTDRLPGREGDIGHTWNLRNLPDLGFPYRGDMSVTFSGDIREIGIISRFENAQELEDIANERYGRVPGTFRDENTGDNLRRIWEGDFTRIEYLRSAYMDSVILLVRLVPVSLADYENAKLEAKKEQEREAAEAQRKAREIPRKARLL
ncbi:hypothetical protein [Pusillimonas sp. ANT_WB101]|uniref:hypothetical protein n=1 Tax=Pusillimonas sp. ANT_WB101 TaxID=2597356 RepID=UPI0011EF287F|nr:hypothetical protein [Pusillimonas sp. ANT_WB101]KAA0888485.1 hypothetical protein FQ179_21195 [Pusillimonas sp. ANT_WB101]